MDSKSRDTFTELVRSRAQQLSDDGLCALGALFDLTSQRLVRLAVTVTRHQQDAEDAVQAALIRVADRPQRLAAADCPWAYLLRMVRNEALTLQRRQRRITLVANLSDLLTRRRVDELEQEEQYRSVWRALRRLPREQSEVVVLKIWEDMTFAQIADVLDISANTAASRYRYAMEKLTDRLQSLRDPSEVKHA
jgi:RNA polymerase sigma-70 factor (ECF subfamily)